MKKIKYLYIPIGGTGKRLRAERSDLMYASKCFLVFHNKSLLIRIIENCKEYCCEVVVVYCTEEQYTDAFSTLGNYIYGMKVRYIENKFKDPYACMLTDGDNLAVMGDSYMRPQDMAFFFEHLEKNPILTFLRFDSNEINQDFAYYKYDGEYIYDWSKDELVGYEHFEIGQILYFPQEIVGQVVDLCLKKDALFMLRKMIEKLSKVVCLKLPCTNINNKNDYLYVEELLSGDGHRL